MLRFLTDMVMVVINLDAELIADESYNPFYADIWCHYSLELSFYPLPEKIGKLLMVSHVTPMRKIIALYRFDNFA